MAKQRINLSDQIRQAIEKSGKTRYAISKATGIAEATLSRFMTGERGLPMKTLDKLGDYLDLRVAAVRRRRDKRG
jgi:transcriptional regulator with XRE-family HTH domain